MHENESNNFVFMDTLHGHATQKVPLAVCHTVQHVDRRSMIKGIISFQDYPSGHLTKAQFQAIYRDFFPDDPKRKNFAEKLFQTYDQNNDGNYDASCLLYSVKKTVQ